jgi:hypothetical protein
VCVCVCVRVCSYLHKRMCCCYLWLHRSMLISAYWPSPHISCVLANLQTIRNPHICVLMHVKCHDHKVCLLMHAPGGSLGLEEHVRPKQRVDRGRVTPLCHLGYDIWQT